MWGLFFLINMVSGMLVRFAMRKLGIVHLIDGDSMTRLTGWMMEFLLLSTLIGIKFAVVKDYILPIIVLSVVFSSLSTMRSRMSPVGMVPVQVPNIMTVRSKE